MGFFGSLVKDTLDILFTCFVYAEIETFPLLDSLVWAPNPINLRSTYEPQEKR